jgi:hypothetical protein
MIIKINSTVFNNANTIDWSLITNVPATITTNANLLAGANTKPIINIAKSGNTLTITFGP